MIDIVMVAWKRRDYTLKAIQHLIDRTNYPWRLILVINEFDREVDVELLREIQHYSLNKNEICISEAKFIANSENEGLAAAKNQALMFVESRIYVDTDNDILCPHLRPCWLHQLLELMKSHSDHAAIALRTHIYVADGNFFYKRTEPVVERHHVGGSLRAMRTDLVRAVGGWTPHPGRGSEEKDICGKLRREGHKVGYSRTLVCYHMFGENWGYGDLPAEEHGHAPRLQPHIHKYDRNLDPKTFEGR